MVIFLLNLVDAIDQHIEDRALSVFRIKPERYAVEAVERSAVRAALSESNVLWGDASSSFLFTTPSEWVSTPELERIANDELLPGEFLLIPYSDGGLISISGTILPFQESPNADDWHRWSRWKNWWPIRRLHGR